MSKRPGQESEEDMLAELDARPTPGSGCGRSEKLDGLINSPSYLENIYSENKSTISNGFRVTKDLLQKCRAGAALNGSPQFLLRLDIDGEIVYVVPKNLFLEMKDRLDSGIEE